jgi:hypothetical protein
MRNTLRSSWRVLVGNVAKGISSGPYGSFNGPPAAIVGALVGGTVGVFIGKAHTTKYLHIPFTSYEEEYPSSDSTSTILHSRQTAHMTIF